MIVQIPANEKNQNLPFFKKNKFDYDMITKNTKEELIKNTDIISCERKIFLFDSSSMLFKNKEDLIEDLILVENRVIHRNTPLAYDYLFANIQLSYMSSYFLFSKPKFEEFKNNPKIFYLYGFSTGYGINILTNNYIDYGFSLFDMVNNYNDTNKINTTCKFSPNKFFDEKCEFLGTIFPNLYTEQHYEFLSKERYNKFYNKLDAEYYFKDLMDNETYIERNRFKSYYKNDFEPEEDFYTLQAIEMICFLFLYYEIYEIDIIYHSKKGINFKNLKRDSLCIHQNKNIKDLNDFSKEIKQELEKLIIFYSNITNIKSTYLILISVNHFAYGFEIIEEKTGKKVELKIPKPEMLERIFTKFTLNNEVYKNLSILYNNMMIDKAFRIGYLPEENDNLELENENETWVESRQNIEDFGEIYYARKT